MADNDTKYYLDYHFPLDLVQAILDQIEGQNDPNNPTPQVDPAQREWFSQPRLPGVTQPSVYAFVVPGMNMNKINADFGLPQAGKATLYTFAATTAATFRPVFGDLYQFDLQVSEGVDKSKWNVVAIDYPGAHMPWEGEGLESLLPGYTIVSGAHQGAQTCINAILATPVGSKFALDGYSQGCYVAALVYAELAPGGQLADRASDYLGATMFGSPVRKKGHTIPGGIDPGGQGCYGDAYCMTDVPDSWWDFADSSPLDPFTTVDATTTAGQDFIACADVMISASGITQAAGYLDILLNALPDLSDQIPAIWQDLSEFVFPFLSPNDNVNGHGNYNKPYNGLANNTLSAVQLAVNYLNSIAPAATDGDATTPFFDGLDPTVFDIFEVDYPRSVPFSVNVSLGISNLMSMINANPGQFVLVGYDQGAVICSAIYNEIRYGSLTHRRADLLGAAMYGNPDRQVGVIAPNTPDPGGHGIAPYTERLQGTESLWWEFARPLDPACTVGDDLTGQWQTTLYEAMVGNYTNDLQMILGLFLDAPAYVPALVNAIFDGMWLNYPTSNHNYNLYIPAGSTKTAVQMGIDYLNQVGAAQRVTLDTNTVECITTVFKLPLSVSELTMDILRMPCVVEAWYQDRQNNWRQCLDMQRSPIRVNVARSDVKSYYKYTTRVYPIVAKQFQLRISRTNDPTLANVPFVVGLRNVLIRRNVYDRSQGSAYFEDEMDALGNVITKYIKDWDATRAADDDPTTFWRSSPMPDPAAVASLFLDVRDYTGIAKTIDKVYIDPVYTGQNLNLYYSSDDYVGVRKLSPITINPDEDENTVWSLGAGRTDASTGSDDSYYRWSFSVGPQLSQAAWIGIEWTPGFNPTNGPPQNPVLYRSIVPDGNPVGSWHPMVYYDAGAGEIALEFNDGTSAPVVYTVAISPLWARGDTLRVVAGWRYGPDQVYLSVFDQRGNPIANLTGNPTDLPHTVSFDGQHEIFDFKGLMTALIIKLEDPDLSSLGFQVSPTYYCDPDPVIPDSAGNVPATTLDNAIYAVAWLDQEHGSGGPDDSHYEDKEWTPIWRDYVAAKGLLYFPQPISLKYLKLEFSNLTEEPYPIYESGIEVQYKVFPVSVTQTSTTGIQSYSSPGGFLGLGNFISVNGIRSVNWLDPSSVLAAVGSVFQPNIPPVVINAGTPYVSDTLPNMGDTSISDTTRTEMGSSYVNRRDALQPYILASDAYSTTIKAEGLQAIAPYTDVPWTDIAAANPGVISTVRSIGALPVQGTDWWIFPGQQLKIPASVMTALTNTSTVTDRKLTTETRVRFNTTSVHRYETKTLKRDAAIAYFAGLREVTPYTTVYIEGEDPVNFDFAHYDADQWVQDPGIVQLDTGPCSTSTPVPTTDTHAVTDVGATLFKSFTTASTFSKVALDFRDSGTIRSDSMWADIAPDSQSISDTALAPYVDTIPDTIPQGFWGDTIKDWADSETAWGEPYQVVSINIDGNRRYQGNRVLHFYRAAGAGQAGIKVTQQTNYVPEGLFRIGCVLYKTTANSNQVTLRLRRVDDGVVIHEEDIDVPTGRWYEYTTNFIAIPNSTDQVYTVEITLNGDDEDDLYLSDLYTEIALIRYFVRLGAVGAFLHEVTDLRYTYGTAYVSTTEPVTDMSVTVEILSPKAWAFGMTATPTYLK